MSYYEMLLRICPLVFIAGFVDSVAGGGGLITLPAYAALNLPMHQVSGTNKFSAVWGTGTSVFKFVKNKKVYYLSAIPAAIFALIGSTIGARIMLLIDDIYLKKFLVVAIPVVAIFVLTKKDFGSEKTKNLSNKKIVILSSITGLIIGAYDGFFGPGTGTFLILIFTTVLGFDVVTSSGNAKLVNFASNIAACITFIINGSVIYKIGIPAALCSMAGNYIGSHLAVKNGVKIIKPIFIVVMGLLLVTIVSQVLN